MAGRIRSIKPELVAWLAFASLTDGAARLFVCLYCLADDHGHVPAAPSYIAGQIFWARQRAAHVIGRLLAELDAAKLILRYRAKGGEYLEIVGWSSKGTPTYQHIDRKQPPIFPIPESTDAANETANGSTSRDPPDLDLRSRSATGKGNTCSDAALPPRSAISSFSESYKRAYGADPTWNQKSERAIAELIAEHGEAEVLRRMAIMFGAERKWPKAPYTVATFVRWFDEFVSAPKGHGKRPDTRDFTNDDYTRPSSHGVETIVADPNPDDFGGAS